MIQPGTASDLELVQASQFSIRELADAYNQARTDYLVKMAMNADQLAEYVHIYDVQLDHSLVAVAQGQYAGLAMIGVRPGRTWMTRLGVQPQFRGRGLAETFMRSMLDTTRKLNCTSSTLEFIQGNIAAQRLFLKIGFHSRREFAVLRRPAGRFPHQPRGQAHWLAGDEALGLLSHYPGRLAWTNEMETFQNAGDVLGIETSLEGGRGWLVFRLKEDCLSHCVPWTETGDEDRIMADLLAHLYGRFLGHETSIENLPLDDIHTQALMRHGFQEVFRRMEMAWSAAGNPANSDG